MTKPKMDAATMEAVQELMRTGLLGALVSEMNLPPGPEDGSYHPASACKGHHCPFHDPSDHHMKDWPKVIRSSALTERICSHGVGHPDPDSLAFFEAHGIEGYGVHGCDGCCHAE